MRKDQDKQLKLPVTRYVYMKDKPYRIITKANELTTATWILVRKQTRKIDRHAN